MEESKVLEFEGLLREEKYQWVETVLVKLRYRDVKMDTTKTS